MTAERADDMVDRDLTITKARAEAFEAMQTRGHQTPRIRTMATQDDPVTVMRGMKALDKKTPINATPKFLGKVGVAVTAAANPSGFARVRLNGTF